MATRAPRGLDGADSATRPPPSGPAGRSRWLDIDWRRHQRWVLVDGQPVNTVELGAGEGQPLLFVHGLSGTWPNWLEQLPVFAREHRVLALDLPGFGHSPMPAGEISIAGYARLLARLLEQRGIDAAAVVGSSMGGLIAAELAVSFPRRVERLVLVSAAGISTYGDERVRRATAALRRLEGICLAAGAWAASNSDALTRRPRLRAAALRVMAPHPGRLHPALAAELVRGSGTRGFFGALEALTAYDLRERLPEIACPTLIVWGERDPVISVRDADVLARLIPDSRKVIYTDTGHVAMLERAQAFNALLKGFLAQ